jgi:ABC-2 type transport system permease protein
VRTPSSNPLLRVPVLSAIWEQRVGLIAWMIGTAVMASFLLSLVTSLTDFVRTNPIMQGYARAVGTSDPVLILLGAFWFGLANVLVVFFAIVQVGRWAAEDAEGRLEMTIAQPVPRWRVVVERFVTLAVTSALVSAAGSLAVAAEAPGQGIHLDAGRMVLATALLVLLALTFGAAGAVLTARLPRAAVPLLSAIAVVSYFMLALGPLFKWPDWTLDLSAFRLYGSPLTEGIFWTGLWGMTATTVVGFAIGLAAMRFREVGS